MIKNIYVISDVELGQGDIFDDFKDEQVLIKFLKFITQEKGKNILVMNGDSFDFLKMHHKETFSHHITEEVSLWKIKRIVKTYPRIFEALRSFLNKSANRLHFNIGNHDYDLYWPEVQKYLKEVLIHKNKITFAGEFQNRDIHIEHGHQVDYFYKQDLSKPFLKYKGKELLNLPFGYLAVSKYFIELKRHFPHEEKIYPRHHAFESYPEFRKMKQKIAWNFAVKGIALNFIMSLGDPVARVPYFNLIKHMFIHGLELYDESKFTNKRFKDLIKQNPTQKVFIMGHLHLTHHSLNPKKNKIQILTDTWREEYEMPRGEEPVLKTKTYAHAKYENDQLKKVDLLTFSE